jgi:hypothetical protein
MEEKCQDQKKGIKYFYFPVKYQYVESTEMARICEMA